MDDGKNIEVKKAFESASEAGHVQQQAEDGGAAEQRGEDSVHPTESQSRELAGLSQMQEDTDPMTARDAWRRKLNKQTTAWQHSQQRSQTGGYEQASRAEQSSQAVQSGKETLHGDHQAARGGWSAKSGKETQRGQDFQTAQGTVYSGGTYSYCMAGGRQGKTGSKKPFIIFGSILGGIFLLAILFYLAGLNVRPDTVHLSGADTIYENHIGVLYVEGAIMEGDATYSHAYALDAIDGMMKNSNNEGLMLYVNTPGGGVYESDELYLKIKEYQDMTGRPVYAYLGSQATSGGYYISAPADKIAANRNCWTGSIGVTMGNLYDISGLLSRYGISVTTITSGTNKAMGDMTAPLTDEQKQILQSLIDEAYDQFVGIVAEGRNLDEAYVRSISDGRLYTAKQAQSLHLIDDIVDTYDDAIDDMMDLYELWDCEVYEFRYEPEYGLFGSLIQSMDELAEAAGGNSDLNVLTEMMESRHEMPLQYMCEVTK